MNTLKTSFTTKSLLVLLFAFSYLTNASAQTRFKFNQNYMNKQVPIIMVGLESHYSTQSFSFSSNIKELNDLAVTQQGVHFGGLIGNHLLRFKFRKGEYASSPFVEQVVKTKDIGGTINFYGMQLLNKQFRRFEPYTFVSIKRSDINLYGNYVLPADMQKPAPKLHDHRTCVPVTGTPPGDPDLVGPHGDPDLVTEQEPVAPGTHLGFIRVMRAELGVGAELHLKGRLHFINLFGEARYGLTFQQTTNNIAFNNTNVSNPITVQAGLAFGFAKWNGPSTKRSFSRVR